MFLTLKSIEVNMMYEEPKEYYIHFNLSSTKYSCSLYNENVHNPTHGQLLRAFTIKSQYKVVVCG